MYNRYNFLLKTKIECKDTHKNGTFANILGTYWDLLWGLVRFPRFCPYLQKKQQRLVTTAVDVPSYDVPRFTSMSLSNTSGQVA